MGRLEHFRLAKDCVPVYFRMFQDLRSKIKPKDPDPINEISKILKYTENYFAIKCHIYGLQVFNSCAIIEYISKPYLEDANAKQ